MLTIGENSLKTAVQTPLAPNVTFQNPDSLNTFPMDTSHPWRSDNPEIPIDPDTGHRLPMKKKHSKGHSTIDRIIPTFAAGALSTLAMQPLVQSMLGKRIAPPSLSKLLTYALMGGGVASGVDLTREKIRKYLENRDVPEHEGQEVPDVTKQGSWMTEAFEKDAGRLADWWSGHGGLTGMPFDAAAAAIKRAPGVLKKVVGSMGTVRRGLRDGFREAVKPSASGTGMPKNSWMLAGFGKDAVAATPPARTKPGDLGFYANKSAPIPPAPPSDIKTPEELDIKTPEELAQSTPYVMDAGTAAGSLTGRVLNRTQFPARTPTPQTPQSTITGGQSDQFAQPVPNPTIGEESGASAAGGPNVQMPVRRENPLIAKARGNQIMDAKAGKPGITAASQGTKPAAPDGGAAGTPPAEAAGPHIGLGQRVKEWMKRQVPTLQSAQSLSNRANFLDALKKQKSQRADLMGRLGYGGPGGTIAPAAEDVEALKKDDSGLDMKSLLPLFLLGGGSAGGFGMMPFGGGGGGGGMFSNIMQAHFMNQALKSQGGLAGFYRSLLGGDQAKTEKPEEKPKTEDPATAPEAAPATAPEAAAAPTPAPEAAAAPTPASRPAEMATNPRLPAVRNRRQGAPTANTAVMGAQQRASDLADTGMWDIRGKAPTTTTNRANPNNASDITNVSWNRVNKLRKKLQGAA